MFTYQCQKVFTNLAPVTAVGWHPSCVTLHQSSWGSTCVSLHQFLWQYRFNCVSSVVLCYKLCYPSPVFVAIWVQVSSSPAGNCGPGCETSSILRPAQNCSLFSIPSGVLPHLVSAESGEASVFSSSKRVFRRLIQSFKRIANPGGLKYILCEFNVD